MSHLARNVRKNRGKVIDMTGKSAVLSDRVAGVLVGMACGDALGAGYEFGGPLADDYVVEMAGGGAMGWRPGEWTDDTSMAIAVARAAANGEDLRDESTQDAVVLGWLTWMATAKDVGIQTRHVLSAVSASAPAASAAAAALGHHERRGRSGGNGSLMRTAPVALAFLDDPSGLVAAARAISSLTHYDPDAADACVLWCLAIREAVVNQRLDLHAGISWLDADRQEMWRARIADAQGKRPRDFTKNGWVVEALLAAWSSICEVVGDELDAESLDARVLQKVLEAAVRGGRDTDTVAAIAGMLIGGRLGVSAVPVAWQRVLHGWPGLRQHDLVDLALAVRSRGSEPGPLDFGYLQSLSQQTPHPTVDRVVLGPVNAAPDLSDDVDAVVSLCRVGTEHLPPGLSRDEDHVRIWLIDSTDPAANAHLEFVLDQAATAVVQLRREGRTVFLHCAAGQSRTPVIAALVAVQENGVSPVAALDQVSAALPDAQPNDYFTRVVADWSTAPQE
jgi:ADP-ribosyl-[dinitrogen reductase] hydrolase